MNIRREEFDDLSRRCHEARLSSPQLRPSRLGDSWEISIPGGRSFVSSDPKTCIQYAVCYVEGYVDSTAKAEARDSDMEITTLGKCDFAGSVAGAASLAKQVLSNNGEGGPDDHELLAMAVLELTTAILKGKPDA